MSSILRTLYPDLMMSYESMMHPMLIILTLILWKMLQIQLMLFERYQIISQTRRKKRKTKARETLNFICRDCFNRKYNIIIFRYTWIIFINCRKKDYQESRKKKTSKSQKRKDYPNKDEFDQYHYKYKKSKRNN